MKKQNNISQSIGNKANGTKSIFWIVKIKFLSFNSLFKEEADIAIIIDYLKDFPTHAPADNLDSLKSSVINFM